MSAGARRMARSETSYIGLTGITGITGIPQPHKVCYNGTRMRTSGH